MAAESKASTRWEGDLATGSGTTAFESGVIPEVPVSWASRTERAAGKTSPEELLAGAHSSCFSMALAHELAQAGTPPQGLDVSATVTFAPVEDGFAVQSSKITVRGRVPGIDQAAFERAASAAGEGCPVSKALAGVAISVDATLEA
jgi:lipoyl-dependent peroxiredoxin